MKEKLLLAWEWLVSSSEDPRKVSLTLKGFIPFIMAISVWSGLDMSEGALVSVMDAVTTALVSSVALVGALTSIVGFIRKLINTIKN